MDNSNFEQQFTQNLRSTPVTPTEKSEGAPKLPLIISLILSIVVVIESVVLTITLVNYFGLVNGSGDDFEELVLDDNYDESDYVYDSEDNLTAFNATCRSSENGSYFVLSTNNGYKEYGPSSALSNSGTYTVTRDSVISLTSTTGDKKTLYYDGLILADGTIIYECDDQDNQTTE